MGPRRCLKGSRGGCGVDSVGQRVVFLVPIEQHDEELNGRFGVDKSIGQMSEGAQGWEGGLGDADCLWCILKNRNYFHPLTDAL